VEDEILGFYGGGISGGWGVTVEAGDRYAVLAAAYAPNDQPDNLTTLPYTVGISLVSSESDGTAGLCPLLPDELETEEESTE
jgi:hypothetical protein